MRDDALRQIVSLNVPFQREAADLRYQTPMAADRALDQALMAECIQAAVFAVALASRKQKRQIARLAGINKAPL